MSKPKMCFYAIIYDNCAHCPGESQFGPFYTRKEAQWRAEHELSAAAELFTDGRVNLSYRVVQR